MADLSILECNRCGTSKPSTDFNRRPTRRGYRIECKACEKCPRITRVVTHKICRRCGIEKPALDFMKNAKHQDGLQGTCKACHNVEGRRRYRLDICGRKGKAKADCDKFRKKDPIRWNSFSKKWLQTVRAEVIEHYSEGTNACACCGIDFLEFLAVDHIAGNGNAHRREHGITNMYNWLKKNGFPLGFRILCHNCNASRGYYGYCPHDEKR